MAKKLRTASHYIATSLPLTYLIGISKTIDALSNPLCDIPWAKKGKYKYCHQFSNSEIWLNLLCSVDFERHNDPDRHVQRVGYIQSESIGLKYFPDDMLLLKLQYSYLPFFAHWVYSRIVSCASSPPHGRQNPCSNSYRTFLTSAKHHSRSRTPLSPNQNQSRVP